MHNGEWHGRHGGGFGQGRHAHGFGIRRGEFRFLVLLTLKEGPRHGYSLIQEISKFYHHPVSPGIVYPTLQELLEERLLELQEMDGKKVYSITREGNAFLNENREISERLEKEMEISERIDEFDFMKNMEEIENAIIENEKYLSSEKLKKIEDAIKEVKSKVLSIMFESQNS